MLNDEQIVTVRNRENSRIGYNIDDMGIQRIFMPGEVKKLKVEELRRGCYNPGIKILFEQYLVIEDENVAREILNMDPEPEYYYTSQQIDDLLTKGTIEEFLDCLDFAPIGVIEQIKDRAVILGLNDVKKRKAILDKTGYDVTAVLNLNAQMAAEEMEENDEPTPKRRVVKTAPVEENTPSPTGRRVAAPQSKYKVVNK